jgi:hypothetical protein
MQLLLFGMICDDCINNNSDSNNNSNNWTVAEYLLQTRRPLDRIHGRNSKPKIQMPSLGSRLALFGSPYRPAMMEH